MTLPTAPIKPISFQRAVLKWYQQHGRKDLPWQQNKTPYRVWVSEIMLQQTQVATVMPYFKRFMTSFPTVQKLAKTSLDDVLNHWTGLGYYARGRNLHKAANIIVTEYQSKLPADLEQLQDLPGIGRSTAGAILASGFELPASILDGNVKRVLARFHTVPGWYGQASVLKQLWHYSDHYTPKKDIAAYTQAMMDLGAMICTRSKPSCDDCPLQKNCHAFATNQQKQFPTPKPRKTIPQRASQFIILRNPQGKVLLEQRPQSGIWGGLWCFPEFDNSMALSQWCKQRYGVKLLSQQTLEPFRHTFTHFHLDITPVLLDVELQLAVNVDQTARIWYNLQQIADRGFATPIKRLMKTLQHQPLEPVQ